MTYVALVETGRCPVCFMACINAEHALEAHRPPGRVNLPAPLTGDVEYYVVANNGAGPAQSATFTDLHYSPCKP